MELWNMISSLTRVIAELISIMGMWNIFIKFGKKGYTALIPFYRVYVLGDVAGKHQDGFFMMIFSGLSKMSIVVSLFITDDDISTSAGILLLFLFCVICEIPYFIFSVRVFMGMCDAFGKRKLLGLLWSVTYIEWIFYLVFGFSKKLMPLEQYIRHDEETVEAGGIDVAANGRDLSVNIRKRTVNNFFKEFTLLRDLHLTIPTGHMVLLLGGSGAGKTTFLNAVTGYEKADATINLGKWDVYRDYNKMKYDIGFVPQQDLMRGNDTVYRTVADAASLRLNVEMGMEEKKKRINEVLDIFGLSPLKDSLVSKLSGGQRKRLSIALEYISYPTLFILDEPDSGLDGVVARNLFLKLREIADTGKIVIVITHTPDRVIDLFDDLIVLAKDNARTGRLAYYGPVEDAYGFFGKDRIEDILLSINQKEEGGEGRAEEFVGKFNALIRTSAGGEA